VEINLYFYKNEQGLEQTSVYCKPLTNLTHFHAKTTMLCSNGSKTRVHK